MAIQHLLTAESAPKKAGVYAIVCEPTGKRYVGSSINIRERLFEHTRALNKRVSNSRLLQNAWNKYGALAFHFEVLELTPPSRILKVEQKWLDFYKSAQRPYGFNIRTRAMNNYGMRHSKETRLKMSRSRKGQKRTPEQCENIRRALTGLKRTPEQCARISAARSTERQKKLQAKRNKKMWTEARRAAQSKKLRGKANPVRQKEVRAKISASLKGRSYASMGRVVSKATRRKLSAIQKGKHVSLSTRKKLSKIAKKYWETHPLNAEQKGRQKAGTVRRAKAAHLAFIKNTKSLRKEALKLSNQGMRQKDIAKKLGLVWQSHVSRLIAVEKSLQGMH